MVKVKLDLAKAAEIFNALRLATPAPGETVTLHETAIRHMRDAIDDAIKSGEFAAYAESKCELDRLAAPTRY